MEMGLANLKSVRREGGVYANWLAGRGWAPLGEEQRQS